MNSDDSDVFSGRVSDLSRKTEMFVVSLRGLKFNLDQGFELGFGGFRYVRSYVFNN